MPARAPVPVEAFPCTDRFRGHGPLLQKARRIVVVGGAPPGGSTRGSPLLIRHAARPPRASGPRGGHGPLLQKARRIVVVGGAPPGGYTRGSPLVGTPRGQAAAGQRAERRPWAPPTESAANCHGRLVRHRGIYKGLPPCWYATRPSRRGPAAREAAMGPSYRGLTLQ